MKDDISLHPVVGWPALVIGCGLMVWGWLFDATTGADYGSVERFFNIGLVTMKLSILITGGVVALAGAITLAAYGVRKDIRERGPSA